MSQSNRILAFSSAANLVYKTAEDEADKEFLKSLSDKKTQLCQRLDQCINTELSYKIRPRKEAAGRGVSTSETSAVRTSTSVVSQVSGLQLQSTVVAGVANGASGRTAHTYSAAASNGAVPGVSPTSSVNAHLTLLPSSIAYGDRQPISDLVASVRNQLEVSTAKHDCECECSAP